MKPFHFLGLALSAAVAFAWPTAGALAQTEPIILKVEHMMPERSTANLHVVTPWCENIEAASGGRLKCEIYPSMQLGGKPAQLPTLLRNGVIDVIWTAYGYSAGAFPRSEVLELPFLIPQDMHLANQILWDYMTSYGSEDVADFKLLGVFSDGGGAFHTAKKAIASPDDLSGLRIRASTRMVGKLLSALDTAPVSMPPGQIADAISKGVMDGVLGVWELLPPTKLDETAFHHTEPGAGQATVAITPLTMMMNKERYEGLPEDLRAGLGEAMVEAAAYGNQIAADINEHDKQAIIDAGKAKVVQLSADDVAAWREAVAPVLKQFEGEIGSDVIAAAQACNE